MKHMEDPIKVARRKQKAENPYKKFKKSGTPTKKHLSMSS